MKSVFLFRWTWKTKPYSRSEWSGFVRWPPPPGISEATPLRHSKITHLKSEIGISIQQDSWKRL
jgi:hypothetical protein